MSWDNFLEKFFCSVLNGFIGSFRKNPKNSKLQKCPRSYRKMCKLLLNRFCGIFLEKKNSPCSMEGRAFEKIKKNQKILKIPKKPKTFPKVCKRVLNMFWGNFFQQTFAQCSMEGRVSEKFQKSKKAQNHSLKCSTMFWTCFGAIFLKTLFAPCSMEGRAFESFQKIQKNSKFQKSPKSFPKVSKRVLNMLWGDFSDFFLPSVPCRAFQIFWTWKHEFRFPKQYSTDCLSAFTPQSKYAIPFQILWTQNYEFRFPKLKMWVQFSGLKTMNSVFRHNTQQSLYCINATVNKRDSISDFLDLKLWVQIPDKHMSSVFRTWKIWVQFSGLILWGRDLDKIKEKNQKKNQSSRNVQRHSQVSNRVLGRFFLPSVPVFHGVIESFRKKIKENSKLQKTQNCSQKCPNLFWTCFVAFFSKKMPRVPWRVGFRKI